MKAEVSSIGKQDDDIICERDHQTRFVTPVTNEALEEVMKDGIPQKTKANTSNGDCIRMKTKKTFLLAPMQLYLNQWLHSN